jgi:hypothetical protein
LIATATSVVTFVTLLTKESSVGFTICSRSRARRNGSSSHLSI